MFHKTPKGYFDLRDMKRARIMIGKTQKEVSEDTGISQSVINTYESGKISPSLRIYFILVIYFKEELARVNSEKVIL